MPDVAIMIEGQDGLNWERWQRLARAAEDLGFAGLFRSDHFTNADGPHLDALELWASLTWLASHTRRIEFGQMVSPVGFRNPVVAAWTAAAVDDLAGGRLRLGLGAGWQEREHRSYGFDLLDLDARFQRLREALEVVTRLLRSDQPSAFDGEFYHLEDALLLPRPKRPGGPPIVIGGNGARRTLPLVAEFADEWNAVYASPDRFATLSAELDRLLDGRSRPRDAVKRTLMTRVVVGRDEAEVTKKLNGDPQALRDRGVVLGVPNEIVDQLSRLGEAGVSRVMAQWLDMDDIDGLQLLAAEVLPQLG
ncbi:MAG TPA: TIGR03560 family F420-dependent LLM class oxidoreductase [Thermomicrobiales bacterium]